MQQTDEKDYEIMIKDALKRLDDQGTDVFSYCGPILKSGYDELCRLISEIDSKNEKAILILCTFGGDPNAGYRIARAIIHHYGSKNFSIAVPTYCKSAGTLVCIGASELIFFDSGELGPLDTQIIKQDELFQRSSGLDILRGMNYLQDQALSNFKEYLVDITQSAGISTKVASEIAVNMVKGLYTPIYAQIDPLRLGEMNAALQIANEYGSRLNEKSGSLMQDALTRLIHHYPTHGFVIDRAEARTLFRNVTAPNVDVKLIGEFVKNGYWNQGFSVRYLNKLFHNKEDNHVDAKSTESPPNADDSDGASSSEPSAEQIQQSAS